MRSLISAAAAARTLAVSLSVVALSTHSLSAQEVTPGLPDYLAKEWAVSRFIDLGGHVAITPARAAQQVGKRINLQPRDIHYDRDLLWFGAQRCNAPAYRVAKWVIGEYEVLGVMHKGSLAYHGAAGARPGEILELWVDCGKQKRRIVLEITQQNHLAAYYDGHIFYLDPTEVTR
jgi:hypothetical protein